MKERKPNFQTSNIKNEIKGRKSEVSYKDKEKKEENLYILEINRKEGIYPNSENLLAGVVSSIVDFELEAASVGGIICGFLFSKCQRMCFCDFQSVISTTCLLLSCGFRILSHINN